MLVMWHEEKNPWPDEVKNKTWADFNNVAVVDFHVCFTVVQTAG